MSAVVLGDALRYLAARADALTAERDRLAAEVAEHGKSSDLLQAGHEAGMAFAERMLAKVRAERDELRAERDEARAEAESLQRAAQVTDASWREHVERADKAEAAVARVRKVLPDLLATYWAAGAATPAVAVLEAARLLVDAALDGVDAGGEA